MLEITIKGEPNEIATLVLAVQERQKANILAPGTSVEFNKSNRWKMIAELERRLVKLRNGDYPII